MISSLSHNKTKLAAAAARKMPVLTLRLPEQVSEALDAWIAAQPEPRPSRSEAVRAMIAIVTGIGREEVLTLDQKIAFAKGLLNDIDVPSSPSPARGMALLRQGLGENNLRTLKERKRRRGAQSRQVG